MYDGLELLSESECQWKDNVDAVQHEVAIFNDRRAALHEAKVRSDVSEQWDPSCTVKQDKVRVVCWLVCLCVKRCIRVFTDWFVLFVVLTDTGYYFIHWFGKTTHGGVPIKVGNRDRYSRCIDPVTWW